VNVQGGDDLLVRGSGVVSCAASDATGNAATAGTLLMLVAVRRRRRA
jgi:MYXO-CTERM domain-containing protein